MARWTESWEVESRSEPGKFYVVSRDEDGNFGCSCLAWTRQRKECKHIRLMKGQLKLEEQRVPRAGNSPLEWATAELGRQGISSFQIGPTRVAKSASVKEIAEEPKKRRRFVL
jgi:hypothetical protein